MTRRDAFISYSSKDQDKVRHLHRALEERYADLPRSLRGDKLHLHIVLDREDFEAGGGIGDQVGDHLDASAHLLVICSPASVQHDTWVTLEVERFLSNKPRSKVLLVLLEAEDPVGWEDIPKTMRQPGPVELFVDARAVLPERPVPTDVLHRIYAHLLELPYAQLRDRHGAYLRSRRRRRLAAGVAAVTLLLAGVSGGLVLTAEPVLAKASEPVPGVVPALEPRVSCTRDGAAAVGGGDGHLHLVRPDGTVATLELFDEDLVGDIAWDGSHFVATNLGSEALIWVAPDGSVARRVTNPADEYWVRVEHGGADGLIYAGDDAGGVWSIAKGQQPRPLFSVGGEYDERVESMVFRPEARALHVLSADGLVVHWGPDGEVSRRRVPHLSMATALAIGDDSAFVAGHFDEPPPGHFALKRIDAAGSEEQVSELPRALVNIVDIDPRTFLVVRSSGEVGVWDKSSATQVDSLSLEPTREGISQNAPALAHVADGDGLCAVDANGLHRIEERLRTVLGFTLPRW